MLIYTTVFNGLAPTTIPCIDSIKWLANLRVLEVTEIKKVPYVPLSHRLSSGSLGPYRECLDSTLFWTTTDLEARLLDFQHYYNEHRTHAGCPWRPAVTGVNADRSRANLSCYRWSRLIPNADGCLILVIRHRQGAEPQSGVLFL